MSVDPLLPAVESIAGRYSSPTPNPFLPKSSTLARKGNLLSVLPELWFRKATAQVGALPFV